MFLWILRSYFFDAKYQNALNNTKLNYYAMNTNKTSKWMAYTCNAAPGEYWIQHLHWSKQPETERDKNGTWMVEEWIIVTFRFQCFFLDLMQLQTEWITFDFWNAHKQIGVIFVVTPNKIWQTNQSLMSLQLEMQPHDNKCYNPMTALTPKLYSTTNCSTLYNVSIGFRLQRINLQIVWIICGIYQQWCHIFSHIASSTKYEQIIIRNKWPYGCKTNFFSWIVQYYNSWSRLWSLFPTPWKVDFPKFPQSFQEMGKSISKQNFIENFHFTPAFHYKN